MAEDNLFGNIFQGGVSAAGLFDQSNRITQLGADSQASLDTIGQEGMDNTEFRGFSVASGTGNVDVAGDGSVNAQLNQPQQDVSNAALGSAGTLFDQAGVDINSRQGVIFDQMMAGMQPGMDRDRLGLEGRLQSQGRGGISSAAFGGSPEQFAMHKAQEEARLGAMTDARGIALNERGQEGNMADLFNRSSMLQDAGLFNQLGAGTQTANLGQTGALAGADIRAQTATAGVEANVNANKVAAELAAGGYAGLAGAAGAFGTAIDQTGDGLFSGAAKVINETFF